MTGKLLCLLLIGACLAGLLILFLTKQEKHKKDAVKALLLAACLGLLACVSEEQDLRLDSGDRLKRNPPGGQPESEELRLNAEGVLEDYDYTVEIEARRLTGKDKDALLEAAAREAETAFLADNQSPDDIRSDVALPKSLQDGQVDAAWEFSPEGWIDADGKLQTEELAEDGQLIHVSVTLSYYGESREHLFGCMLYPPQVSEKDRLLAAVAGYFEREKQKQGDNSAYLKLPQSLEGHELFWTEKQQNTYQMILLLGILASVLVYANHWVKAQEREKLRRQELLRQYPDMVSKLSLLLGAGMTLSGAWGRIVQNYQMQRKNRQTGQQEVYEQMLLSYREMQDGIGELKVYERFGERCGLPQYRKLTTIINQNLRKGSAGLTDLLEKEVAEAFALRKNHAKKAGEEAGTKLLLPMVLMLCIVMAIIIVPAMVSFQM